MNNDANDLPPPKKIGEYLKCDSQTIARGLETQKRLSGERIRKRLGEILLDLKYIRPQELSDALCQQRIDRFKQSPLFFGLSDFEINKFSDFIYEKSVVKGQLVIEQDTQGESFYVLMSGKLQVFRRGEYDESYALGTVTPGECIGEMGFFSDGRRSASVIALEESLLVEIGYWDLKAAFDHIPILSRNFLRIVTRRLYQSNIKFQETVQKTRRIETAFTSIRNLIDLSHIQKFRLGIEGLIERVVLTASKVLNAERATLFLVDTVAGELWSKVAEGETHRDIRIPIGSGIAGWVVRHDQIANIKDAYRDPRFNPQVDKLTGFRTNSILCGPVKNLEGEIVGVIQVINKQSGSFDEQDKDLFKAFAYQTGISVENFYLYNKMSTSCWKMGLFLDISMSLSETLELNPLISKIIAIITKLLDADRSSLFILDREKKELWSKVAQGAEMTEIRFPSNTGMAGYTATTGQTLNVKDAYKDPRFNPKLDKHTHYKTKTVLCAPVVNRQGQIIGVMQSINKKAGFFTNEDEELLKALSSQVAVALENSQLYENALDMKNYLESIHHSITDSIMTLDNHYIIITANESARKFFQTDINRIIPFDIRDLLGPENGSFIEKIDKVYQSKHPVTEYDIPIRMGQTDKYVNINFIPLLDAKGKQKGQVLIFEDISLEKRMKSTLTRYMTKDIAEKLISDPERASLGGVSSKATIVFSDISDFTSISEKLPPEQIVEFLNKYYTVMVDIVFKNGGILDKYIGDAIMAVFGVPYERPDDAERAVRTSLEMVDVLAAFNQDIVSLGIPPIKIRIGIATGMVISGNIGSEKRMDFTVIGDGVNVSSRLENLNKLYGTTILMDEHTTREIADKFLTRPIDLVLIKGRSQPIEIFEALGGTDCILPEGKAYFSDGLALYRKKEFLKAAHYFNLGKDSDLPSLYFLKRCEHFAATPPPKDWDCIWISEQK